MHIHTLKKVEDAIDTLENADQEYRLSDLISKSGISKGSLVEILKEKWVQSDELNIFNLELTAEEEQAIFF